MRSAAALTPETVSGAGKLAEPDTITADLAEARDILAGRSTAAPQFRHLAALQSSAQYWKSAASEANELIVLLESLYDQRAAAADWFADQVCGEAIH